MEFITAQGLLFTSKRFENIYLKFKNDYGISYPDLFCLVCSIGFIENKRTKLEEKGREMRVNYFSNNSEKTTIIYTILLEDKELNIEIEDLLNKDLFTRFRNVLEEYAEGGMCYLIENIFPAHIKDNTTVKAYDDYIVDIMSYVYDSYNKTPF